MSRRISSSARRAKRRHRLELQEAQVIGRILRGEATEISVDQLPLVNRDLGCALPLFGYSEEWPDYPQAQGTAVAMEFDGVSFLLATKHEVDGAPVGGIVAPLFSGPMDFRTREGIAKPYGCFWPIPDDPDDADRSDLALMPFGRRPSWGCDVRPLRLDRIASSTDFNLDAPFALAGYPRTRVMMNMDYDAGILRRDPFITLGKYVGATSWPGCHTLACDTNEAGGADGLSGSPVLRLLFDDMHKVEWGFAGVVVRGGSAALHFIDAIHVVQLIRSTARRHGWPPLLRPRASAVASLDGG